MRSFRSDNNAGLCPEALQAAIAANDGSHQVGYGEDACTADAEGTFRKVFGQNTAVFFVATGTAANTLAIASLTQPWQEVMCHLYSHCNTYESTAPERISRCRLVQVHAAGPKLTPKDIARAASRTRGEVHQPQPGVVTISNPTEFGTVYTPDEVRQVCVAAHEAGYLVHVDGARFANAVSFLECDPRELTVEAGVDAMSFGGTKNGLALGEAVLFFAQGDGRVHKAAAAAFPYHRMGTGHLLSKHRFLTAPFTGVLRDGAWLRHAGHANAMATRPERGLRGIGLEPAFPVESNGVFIALPEPVKSALQAAGHGYYDVASPKGTLARLMCSFDTHESDIAKFVDDAKAAIGQRP